MKFWETGIANSLLRLSSVWLSELKMKNNDIAKLHRYELHDLL